MPSNKKPAPHTPTPWRVVLAPCQIVDDKNLIADLNGKGFEIGEEEKYANAAFIVRAVNAHHELVEALKRIADEAVKTGTTEDGRSLESIAEIAFRAIAKAEGRQ